ncbi:pro-FMRFamide-related neuropeptide VF [Pseudophryne corroboree]|uniref:pro-FMRFamide-related neuropeptide VF n=1 Tax=Pseudophryne corroboree TaxID=495146 RepID=UPI0030820625
MLFSLYTFSILFAFSICSDETAMTNLESQEKYDDLFESREDFHNQRNANSAEYRYWRPNSVSEMSAPIMSKYSSVPIQLDRELLEERSLKPAANLPLRFGRASDEKIVKSFPNLPQRFGRYLSGKANIQSVANLPQRFGRSQYGGNFHQSLASLPLRLGRATRLQRLQYKLSSHPLKVKNSDVDDRREAATYDYEHDIQI